MSEENVEVFRRGMEAYNRRDIDAFLETFDPMAEIHPLTLAMFGQEATVYRGDEGIRQFIRDVAEALPQIQVKLLEIRDLGERIVASGRLHARGRAKRGRGRIAHRLGHRVQRGPGDSDEGLSRSKRFPRSRRAVGVGDV
jgi:hypothetical protein